MNPLALLGWWREILIGLLVVVVLFQGERLNTKSAELDALVIKAEAQQKDFASRTKANEANKERTDADLASANKRIANLKLQINGGTPITASKETFAAGNYAGPACVSGRELYIGIGVVAQRSADRFSDFSAASAKRDGERFKPLAQAVEQLAASYRGCQAFSVGEQ